MSVSVVSAAPAHGGVTVSEGPESGATRLALLIDDHPAIRFALRQVLSRVGAFEIREAGTSAEGVSIFHALRPALVLVDLDLPDADGLDIIRRMRRQQPEVRLLAVTALDEQLFAPRARHAGANGFIAKHQRLELIEAALTGVIAGMECFPATQTHNTMWQHPTAALTEREMSVVRCLVKGMRNKEIAVALFINEKTVSTHKTRIFEKTGVSNVIDLQQIYCERAPQERLASADEPGANDSNDPDDPNDPDNRPQSGGAVVQPLPQADDHTMSFSVDGAGTAPKRLPDGADRD